MAELTSAEAIARARAAVGLGAAVTARAWRVRRLDRPGEAYFLVVFGDDKAAVGVAAVDAAKGEVGTSARLAGRGPHLTGDAAWAVRQAGLDPSARAELVWKPSRASRSPLYPLWEIDTARDRVYVDQQGAVWRRLDPPGPGG